METPAPQPTKTASRRNRASNIVHLAETALIVDTATLDDDDHSESNSGAAQNAPADRCKVEQPTRPSNNQTCLKSMPTNAVLQNSSTGISRSLSDLRMLTRAFVTEASLVWILFFSTQGDDLDKNEWWIYLLTNIFVMTENMLEKTDKGSLAFRPDVRRSLGLTNDSSMTQNQVVRLGIVSAIHRLLGTSLQESQPIENHWILQPLSWFAYQEVQIAELYADERQLQLEQNGEELSVPDQIRIAKTLTGSWFETESE